MLAIANAILTHWRCFSCDCFFPHKLPMFPRSHQVDTKQGVALVTIPMSGNTFGWSAFFHASTSLWNLWGASVNDDSSDSREAYHMQASFI